jgi:NADH-ubiquinone oxidoreductase chain 4
MLIILVLFTILLGIYPSIVLDGLHYYVYNLLYSIYFK